MARASKVDYAEIAKAQSTQSLLFNNLLRPLRLRALCEIRYADMLRRMHCAYPACPLEGGRLHFRIHVCHGTTDLVLEAGIVNNDLRHALAHQGYGLEIGQSLGDALLHR